MLEEAFDDYVSNYDLNNKDIKLKYNHSYRVMELQEKYAKMLGFDKENIELARVIGLLHDIGRFEQLRVYDTYDDSNSVDHADYSCVQLFEKGEIKKFVLNDKWYPIIDFAIRNHNKKDLDEVNDEQMMLQAKLIRDTDKIDIIYLLGYLKEIDITPIESELSSKVIDDINNRCVVSKKDVLSKNDFYAMQYSFVFDINFDECLEEIKKNYKYYFKTQKSNKIMKSVYEQIMEYIDERLEK